ncbi:MAG: hypothetical protein MSC30_03580 [Gaiellaceae bacterium MAG52_C11]|nr:hypothetical protein [Candidatus Gaiellasilicea maunaloa]
MAVTFIDTSILCELLRVPGKCQQHEAVRDEFELRIGNGDRFVIPITAVIETGNHIAQAGGDRRGAADRFCKMLASAASGEAPFVIHQESWDERFLEELCSGNGTGQQFIDLAGNGQMGAGDVAILVERDRFRTRSAYGTVGIWTLENVLGAYA